MLNFRDLALKLRDWFDDDEWTYCKNAKFQTATYRTKTLLMLFAKLTLSLRLRGVNMNCE